MNNARTHHNSLRSNTLPAVGSVALAGNLRTDNTFTTPHSTTTSTDSRIYSRTVDAALVFQTEGALIHDGVCEEVLIGYLVRFRNDVREENRSNDVPKRKRSLEDSGDDNDGSASNDGSDDNPQPRTTKRANSRSYSDDVYAVLEGWMREHRSSPYPSEKEKQELVDQTRLKLEQVNNWMSNTRRRVLKMRGQRKK